MKTILIVDDELVLAETMSLILSRAGYRIFTANNGQEAKPIIEQQRPDLVITDLAMPGMDGLKLMEWIRDHRSLDGIRIMMMTGKPNALQTLQRYHLPSDCSLAKPFTEATLLEKVATLIG